MKIVKTPIMLFPASSLYVYLRTLSEIVQIDNAIISLSHSGNDHEILFILNLLAERKLEAVSHAAVVSCLREMYRHSSQKNITSDKNFYHRRQYDLMIRGLATIHNKLFFIECPIYLSEHVHSDRYKCLSSSTWPNFRGPARDGVQVLVNALNYDKEDYRMGK